MIASSSLRPILLSIVLPIAVIAATAASVPRRASAAAGDAAAFRKTCEQLGGFSEADFQCACFGSARQVDPRKAGQSCIEDNLRLIDELVGEPNGKPCSKLRRSADSGRLELRSFAQTLSCQEPARFFCDPKKNPTTKKVLQTRETFRNLVAQAQASPEMESYFKEKTGTAIGACWRFRKPEDTAECYSRANAIVEKKIFTDERRKKTQEIFEGARKAMIRVLEDRLSFARNALGAEERTLEYLRDSLETLKKATLKLELPPRYGWNASARHSTAEIFVEGVALLADENPGALYKTILHELGHLTGIMQHFKEGPLLAVIPRAYDERFPFDREIRCLIPDSLKSDPACYQRLSEQAARAGHFAFSLSAGHVANLAQLNPYLPYLLPGAETGAMIPNPPWMSPENDCPRAMHEEALADWLATEALSRLMDHSGTDLARLRNQALIESASALSCATFFGEPELPRSAQTPNGRSVSPARATEGNWKIAHPATEYRINRILFANPAIREAVGCSSEGLVRTPADPGNWDEFTPRYCGTHLYERKSSTEAP